MARRHHASSHVLSQDSQGTTRQGREPRPKGGVTCSRWLCSPDSEPTARMHPLPAAVLLCGAQTHSPSGGEGPCPDAAPAGRGRGEPAGLPPSPHWRSHFPCTVCVLLPSCSHRETPAFTISCSQVTTSDVCRSHAWSRPSIGCPGADTAGPVSGFPICPSAWQGVSSGLGLLTFCNGRRNETLYPEAL